MKNLKTFEDWDQRIEDWEQKRNDLQKKMLKDIEYYFHRYNVNGLFMFDEPVLKDGFAGCNGSCIGIEEIEGDWFLKFDTHTDGDNMFYITEFEWEELEDLLKELKKMYPEADEADKYNI